MNYILKTRFFQICFVSASLLFILWLSTSMWIDAFIHRQDARRIQVASAQEEVLFDLADVVASERHLFYKLFSTDGQDRSQLAELRKLSEANHAFALSQNSILPAEKTTIGFHIMRHAAPSNASSTKAKINNSSMDHDVSGATAGNSTQTKPVDSGSTAMAEHHHHSMHHQQAEQFADGQVKLDDIANRLASESSKRFNQILLPRDVREPMFGMVQFHEYSQIIEQIDGVRRSLHIIPRDSKREFYTHTKLKDAIWNFRESVNQISSLIEGIIALSGTVAEMAQIRHHADMLTELNVRVDLAWNELLKISSASENEALKDLTRSIASWYTDNFRALSTRLSASSRYNSVTPLELKGWLIVARQLQQRANDIRASSIDITLRSVRDVENRAALNLLLVTALVLFTLGMALASMYFFRRVERQAHQDELTGLDNRRMFCINLEKHITAARNSETDLSVLMIDLDRFKYVNDTMGHAAGDQLLRKISSRIASVSKDGCSLARLGGDEFAVLFPDSTHEQTFGAAEKIQQQLMEPFDIDGATVNIGSSIGIAEFPRDADSHDLLIQAADLAMYCGKKSGTNQIVRYDSELDKNMTSIGKLVGDLKAAIQQNQFELYYQPQFNLALKKVVSVEALIRWNHPERGFVSPMDFIPIAEQNGLMPSIGNWVIDEACRQASVWLHEEKMPLRIAVNISADHFFQPKFVTSIIDCLEKHNLPPQFIELEVTESVAVDDMNTVVESLRELQESSIQVALDDFGTGYSSLGYLQDLPLDTLKIDKTFIQKMLLGNLQHDSITETIVSLAKSLGLETVAEGVETADQLSAVSEMRISIVQGYYYSKPVSAKELPGVVQKINCSNQLPKAA